MGYRNSPRFPSGANDALDLVLKKQGQLIFLHVSGFVLNGQPSAWRKQVTILAKTRLLSDTGRRELHVCTGMITTKEDSAGEDDAEG